MLLAETSGNEFEPIPAGAHIARCVAQYDLGTQLVNWQGVEKEVRKVLISWELPSVRIDISRDGGESENLPRLISAQYTASLSPKGNLRKMLEGWRGRPFTGDELKGWELNSVIGVPCQLNVQHNESNGRTYANVAGVMPLIAGVECPEQETPSTTYEIAEAVVPDSTPNWIESIIARSKEWEMRNASVVPSADKVDEIPF